MITVCRNAAKLIEPTMLSVLNQTYGNLDYIVIDGASTDGTTDIIRRYGDRLSYWVSEPDGGIYDAMNKGVQMAQSMVREGETAWVNFMNAGDGFSDNEVVEDFFVDKEGCPPYPEQAKVLIGNFQRTRYSESGAGSEESEVVKTESIDFIPAWMPFCHQAVFMKLNDCLYNNIYIMSNFISFEHNHMIKFSDKMIHSLNKTINSLPDNYKEFLQKQMDHIILNLEIIDKSIDSAELQNEQFVLDFYDKLNKISIRK